MKKLSLAAALIFTLLITPDAESAQVYKCNVNGSVKYQQIPCTNDAVTTPPTGTSTPDPKKIVPRMQKYPQVRLSKDVLHRVLTTGKSHVSIPSELRH